MKYTLTIVIDTQEEFDRVTAALNAKTPAPVAAVTKPVAAAKPAPVVVEPEPEAEDDMLGEETITLDMIRPVVSEKIQAGHKAFIAAELTRLGAKNITFLKPDQYSAFMGFLNNLGV